MAKKTIPYEVEVETGSAVTELAKVGAAGKKAGEQIAAGFDDAASNSQKALAALTQTADKLASDVQSATAAVKALGASAGDGFDQAKVVQFVEKLDKMGVSFDEITADADKFADVMKRIDGIHLDAANAGLETLSGKARLAGGANDDLTASAQKSRNAMANMVGNAAQDLGAFVGIAGSAGVALGQLAEGAADARNDGEGLTSVLKGVAGTALPIAGIAVATQLVGNAMARAKQDAAELEAANRRFVSGLQDTIGAADDLDTALSAAFDAGQAEPIAVAAREFQEAINPDKVNQYQQAIAALGLTNQEYVDILVYVRAVDQRRDPLVRRIEWTPRSGYVETSYR